MPAGTNAEAVGLMRALLRWDVAARLGVEAALAHPYLAAHYEPPAPLPAAGAGLPAAMAGAEKSLPRLAEDILREAALWK